MIFLIAERPDGHHPFFLRLERDTSHIDVSVDSIDIWLPSDVLHVAEIIAKEMKDIDQLPVVSLYPGKHEDSYSLDILFRIRTMNRGLMSHLIGQDIDRYLEGIGMPFPKKGFSIFYSDGVEELKPGYIHKFLEHYEREKEFTLRLLDSSDEDSPNNVELKLTELSPVDPSRTFLLE